MEALPAEVSFTGPHSDISRRFEDLRLFGYDSFTPGLGLRYGSEPMRQNWSQRRLWGNVRKVWLAAAEVQHGVGLVSDEQLAELTTQIGNMSVRRILQLERQTGHDINGAIAEFSEVAPEGGKILHRGMTSEDPLSTAEIMQIMEGFSILRPKFHSTLEAYAGQIHQHKDKTCMAYTHFQAAEPTTVGYRFANHAQNLLTAVRFIDANMQFVRSKGIKGAVGTSASFTDILKGTGLTPEEHERRIMEKLGVPYAPISNQSYPREVLFTVTAMLAKAGQALFQSALDIQMLSSEFIDEVSEPRASGRVDSSAMPFKTGNPIHSENAGSLTSGLPGLLTTSWLIGATVTFERTLRDSGIKRDHLPQAFFIVDEGLTRMERVMKGLEVHYDSVDTNFGKFAPKLALGILIGRLTNAGMDRKEAHEVLLAHADAAKQARRRGEGNPIKEMVLNDPRITGPLGQDSVAEAFAQIYTHVGNAPQKCEAFLRDELYPAIGKDYPYAS